MPGGGAGGNRVVQQADGQGIVWAPESGPQVEEPLRIPDPLSDAQEFFRADRLADHRAQQMSEASGGHGECRELAAHE